MTFLIENRAVAALAKMVWKRSVSPNQLLKSYSAKAQNMGDIRESSLSEIFCTLLLLNSAKLRAYLLRILSRKLKPVITEGKLCQRCEAVQSGSLLCPGPRKAQLGRQKDKATVKTVMGAILHRLKCSCLNFCRRNEADWKSFCSTRGSYNPWPLMRTPPMAESNQSVAQP